MILPQKELVEELKIEWKRLWTERIDDKVRAEGIAIDNYSALFIDKGTIIHATRDFKALNFKDILEQHNVSKIERYIPTDSNVGGWGKFIKENITNQRSKKGKSADFHMEEKTKKQQLKKNGRGWLYK